MTTLFENLDKDGQTARNIKQAKINSINRESE